MDKEKEKSRYNEKNLFRLKNGYILEFNIQKEEHIVGDRKIIFTSFFNEFDNHYILQTSRQYLSIRKDKGRDCITPTVKTIENKQKSEGEIFSKCLENIEELVMKDQIEEKQFDKVEKPINKLVQDYFYSDLHTFIRNPIFNNCINQRTE